MADISLKIKKRQIILLIIYFVVIVGLLGRVAYWQFVEGARLREEVYVQHNRGRIISPRRGTIYDRNGKELAISASVDTVWVNPGDIPNSKISEEQIAEDLAAILEMDEEAVYKKITAKTTYDTIKKKIDREIGDKVRKWVKDNKVEGIYVDEDTKRFFPKGNLASHIIGFTGTDNEGLEGLEYVLEKYLKGTPGRVVSEVDAGNREIPFKVEKRIDPKDGLNAVLTIDEWIQGFTEKALEKAILENKVQRGATAIVMDPRNGDILALASKPDFNLNNPFAPPAEQWVPEGTNLTNWQGRMEAEINLLRETAWRNRALVDTYEPGSTFKVVASCAGLEEGVVAPDTITSDHPVEIGGWELNCWKSPPHGQETFRKGVYNSCNPVFVRIAQELGVDKFYSYVRAFGFFDKTGIMLPEAGSIFHTEPKEIDMAVASFGQGFQITPIQLATAYCAIANGGTLVTPRLVKELTDSEGNIVKRFETNEIRNVLSKETCEIMLDILEGVVTEGTGRNAYIKGYRVAGKTGTSETIPRDSGRYIASFCAIAPADNPKIVALVILDDPRGYSHMGGVIAAPVAGELVEDILEYMDVERHYTDRDLEMMRASVYVPEVRGKTVEEAARILKEAGLQYKAETGGNNDNIMEAAVLEQTPKSGAIIPEKSIVILYTYKPEEEVKAPVPKLTGMTIAEASSALNEVGLNISIDGMGTSVSQEFEAGTFLPKGTVVEVTFRHLDNVE
jgi:stage V sporulation protein D (sporulation-specific penicillin-binding protein)